MTQRHIFGNIMAQSALLRVRHYAQTFMHHIEQMDRAYLRARLMLGGIIFAVCIVFFYWMTSGRWVSTDNAYIHAAKLMVSTDVSGIVSAVEVKEGQKVKAGQILFRVDPRQFEYALQSAQAQLAQIKITLVAAQQDYIRLQSDIAAQEAQVALAEANNSRAAALAQTRAGTDAAYDQARFALTVAQKQLDSLHQQSEAALTRLGGDAHMPVDMHPQYRAARAQVEEAQRQLDHTIVRAPFDGIVTAVDNLQAGTFLVAQTAALTNTGAVGLVSTQSLWIEANVKETDLTFTGVGNPVSITVDAYPNYAFKGRVVSIAPASGAEFSILPAQNSSGNWVKVVQRVPVRIELEDDPHRPPLRSGMSVIADIDTGHHRSISELWGHVNYSHETTAP